MDIPWSPELEAAAEDLVRAYNRLWNAIRGCGKEQAKRATLSQMEAAAELLRFAKRAGAKHRREGRT